MIQGKFKFVLEVNMLPALMVLRAIQRAMKCLISETGIKPEGEQIDVWMEKTAAGSPEIHPSSLPWCPLKTTAAESLETNASGHLRCPLNATAAGWLQIRV
jgi:hypothetical protein